MPHVEKWLLMQYVPVATAGAFPSDAPFPNTDPSLVVRFVVSNAPVGFYVCFRYSNAFYKPWEKRSVCSGNEQRNLSYISLEKKWSKRQGQNKNISQMPWEKTCTTDPLFQENYWYPHDGRSIKLRSESSLCTLRKTRPNRMGKLHNFFIAYIKTPPLCRTAVNQAACFDLALKALCVQGIRGAVYMVRV